MTAADLLTGTGVVPGIAYAPAGWARKPPQVPVDTRIIAEEDRAAETERFRAAAETVAARFAARASAATGAASEVLAATATLAEDRGWIRTATRQIGAGKPATTATAEAIAKFVSQFEKLGGLMAERTTDLKDIRDRVIAEILGLPEVEPDLTDWQRLVRSVNEATAPTKIGIIGKYVSLPDAYLSVVEALKHAGFQHGADVQISWIQAEDVEGLLADDKLRDLDGIVIPGGFGERGVEGKVAAAGYARENGLPCLGLCLGMQVMTIEYARNALGLTGANSTEFDPTTPHPVIDLMDSQRDVTEKGGTMRLGAYIAQLEAGSKVAELYGKEVVSERHRHRYEFNPVYRRRFEGSEFRASGTSPDGRLVEFIELTGHPFWVGTQAHPEFMSRPTRPAPLFDGFIAAALERAEGRNPQLIRLTEADDTAVETVAAVDDAVDAGSARQG